MLALLFYSFLAFVYSTFDVSKFNQDAKAVCCVLFFFSSIILNVLILVPKQLKEFLNDDTN